MNTTEPVFPSITTITVAAPAPTPSGSRVQNDPPSTTLWELNNYNFILHPLQCRPTSHLHARNRHLGASHTAPCWAVQMPSLPKNQKQSEKKDKGKSKENGSHQQVLPPLLQVRARTHLLSYATFRDEDLYTVIRIRAPHSIEAYAPGIPTAGPSSGVNQYGGYLTPQSRPSSGVGVQPLLQLQLQLQLQPQPTNLDDGKRRMLDRKIMEEELRKRSLEQQEK